MPAGTARGLRPAVRHEDASGQALARARGAAAREANQAYNVALAAAAAAGLLLLLPVLNAAGALDVGEGVGRSDVWARSVLCLVLLLVGVQLVSVLLALEHRAYPESGVGKRTDKGKVKRRALAAVWVARVAVVLAIAAAVVVAAVGVPSWGGVAVIGFVVEVAVILWLSVVRRSPVALETRVDQPEADRAPGAVDLRMPPDPRLLAIGASGGGIRAAAFVLGGHQAVQDAASSLRIDDPVDEPDLFAVSGGSYLGAALAMRRRFRLDGVRRGDGTPAGQTPTPWATAYATGSPELERLRRHTRYLFEPTWKTRDGVVGLLMGAVANLLILGLTLRLVSWVAAQVAVSVGLVGDGRDDDGRVELIDWTPAWDHWWQWWPVLVLPVLCLLGIVGVTVWGWHQTAAFDDDVDGSAAGQKARDRAIRRLGTMTTLRTALLFGGLGWLLLVLGIPAAAVGLTNATTNNEPTALSAAVLRTAGFATDGRCADAFATRVDDAVEDANNLARLSPGAEQEVSTGACGLSVTVKRTVDPEKLTVIGPDQEAIEALADEDSLPGQVVGVSALLALVAGLLRRGPSPQAPVGESLRARAKRAVLTWLPLLIVVVVAAYLVVLWTFGFLVGMDRGHLLWAVALTVLACVLAALVDANATSLHGFYRSRLSDAFAVGVDDERRKAEELPPERVYRFSDLRTGLGSPPAPRLHIVTTLNSGKANEAATMRGGFPMVFGADHVDLHREEGHRIRVDTERYEEFCGPGRVSIMATVATSGAAISPLMGRYAVQMAPYRFLMALFNVRVGAWVRNPLHTSGQQRPPQKPAFLWLTAKPGLAQVALEAFGSASADSRWIYLSDGGHLDNTGLVECVRHCLDAGVGGRVLVLDASNDPVDTWSAVGDAVSVIRADLNIDLRRLRYQGQPPWMRRYEGPGLDVVVVKAVRTGPPAEDSTETDWWATLPPNVQSFTLVNADFPRSSTLRQKFGDLEFEAYRGLGYASTKAALLAAGWVAEP